MIKQQTHEEGVMRPNYMPTENDMPLKASAQAQMVMSNRHVFLGAGLQGIAQEPTKQH